MNQYPSTIFTPFQIFSSCDGCKSHTLGIMSVLKLVDLIFKLKVSTGNFDLIYSRYCTLTLCIMNSVTTQLNLHQVISACIRCQWSLALCRAGGKSSSQSIVSKGKRAGAGSRLCYGALHRFHVHERVRVRVRASPSEGQNTSSKWGM